MANNRIKYNQEYNKEHYYRPSVYLPLEYKDKLKKAAEKYTGGNLSQLITMAIDDFFEKNNNQ